MHHSLNLHKTIFANVYNLTQPRNELKTFRYRGIFLIETDCFCEQSIFFSDLSNHVYLNNFCSENSLILEGSKYHILNY